jgi:hypothetical protein
MPVHTFAESQANSSLTLKAPSLLLYNSSGEACLFSTESHLWSSNSSTIRNNTKGSSSSHV